MNRLRAWRWMLLIAAVAGSAQAAESLGPVGIDGDAVTIGRCAVTVGETGLPAQVSIRADRSELSLERRLEGGEPTRTELQFIGRGRRLRRPIRLEAVSGGKALSVDVVTPARLAEAEDGVEASSRLEVGSYAVDMSCTYRPDGSMTAQLTVSDGAPEDLLRLVIEPVQPVDLAFRNLPAGEPGSHAPKELDARLPSTEGVVWDSATQTADNHVRQLYVGSADAGFSLLCPERPKLPVETSHVTLARDDVRRLTWRTVLVSGTGGKARFALLVHPVRSRPADARRQAWLAFPDSTEPVGPVAGPALLRDAGTETPAAPVAGGMAPQTPGYLALASRAQYATMRGHAAADMVSKTKDNVALYPVSLFRALACGPTGLVARVRSNARDLPEGDPRSLDRQVFGRALLHDVGVAPEGVRQPTEFFVVTRALREFGYFADDGLTEYIPYWRLDGIARYGEAFQPDGAFNLSEENPAANTYVSVFRRPYEVDGRRGIQAMFIVVNERDEPVRHRLYVLDLERVLGPGVQRLSGSAVVRELDYGKVPDDSDWRKEKIAPAFRKDYGLRDLENGGFVRASSNKGTTADIYGPLYIPAHDYRLVWACGLPDADQTTEDDE